MANDWSKLEVKPPQTVTYQGIDIVVSDHGDPSYLLEAIADRNKGNIKRCILHHCAADGLGANYDKLSAGVKLSLMNDITNVMELEEDFTEATQDSSPKTESPPSSGSSPTAPDSGDSTPDDT